MAGRALRDGPGGNGRSGPRRGCGRYAAMRRQICQRMIGRRVTITRWTGLVEAMSKPNSRRSPAWCGGCPGTTHRGRRRGYRTKASGRSWCGELPGGPPRARLQLERHFPPCRVRGHAPRGARRALEDVRARRHGTARKSPGFTIPEPGTSPRSPPCYCRRTLLSRGISAA